MNNDKIFNQMIRDAYALPFSGWDFSMIRGRWWQGEPNWDYSVVARARMSAAAHVLDQDTGGGELLASLGPLPAHTFATENYPPNIPVAQERLKPLGVHLVSEYSEDALPFADDYFDLVLNRHGSYAVRELLRMLKPGGVFLTQQVGGKDNLRLNELLQDRVEYPYHDWTLENIVSQLSHAGLEVVQAQECFPENVFMDIGAVVFYLRIISWQVADFAVEKYHPKLFAIHQQIQREGSLVTHSHRILVEARKPNSA
jgi:SAM-dependent methyltransferase